MMKKNLLCTLAAAFALASCSDTELVEMPPQAQEQNAIEFSTYLGDNAQGRATIVTTDTIARDGFGVNAWYTKNATFNNATEKEAFMTNTKVTRNENNVWTYSPLKYWPNNAGHMVSFFAYGPYSVTSQLTNDKTAINFTVESEAKDQVDLIYNSNYSTIDMPKPAVNTHVKFDFKHALARIAFSVEAAVDVVESNKENSANIDANTVINVKRVALVDADAQDGEYEYTVGNEGPFYTGGTLSLLEPAKDDNDKYESPWSAQTGTQSFLLDADNFYRTVEYDSEEVVQLHKFNRKQQLTNDASYLMIIPQDLRTVDKGGASEGFKIYIEYDVITEGENGDSSTITNHIVSKEAMSVNFEQGMAYKFNLVLGMTSVKFNASVAEWDDAADDAYDNEEWLPENTEKPDFEIEYGNNGEHVFLIETPADLAKMRDNVNSGKTYTLDGVSRSGEVLYYAEASYKQTASFSLAEYDNWVPIGRGLRDDEDSSLDNALYAFKGIYDGNNHKISGLTVNANNTESYDGVGLFGMVDWWDSGYPVVKNLTVEGNVTNTGNSGNTGGITGFLGEGTIENCSFTGTVSGPNAGGIAGKLYDYNHYGGIINCYNGGAISSKSVLGGIVGHSSGGKIQACYNYGTLDYTGGNYSYNGAGGILGIAYSESTEIVGCYNSGSITTSGSNVSGSILGKFYLYDSGEPISDATAKVSYCYYSSDATLAAIGSGANKTTITHVGATSDWSEAKDYMNYGLYTNNIAYHYTESENAFFPLKLESGINEGTEPEEDGDSGEEPEEDQTPEGEGDGNEE